MRDTELRVVRGQPSAEDIAILTALVAARGNPSRSGQDEPRRGRWNDPARRVRRYWRPGPGGWSAAGD